ncbi:hypothetical protein D3981_005504 [Escherichia coli]|nr:hypothetical protein [Escherichia coli]
MRAEEVFRIIVVVEITILQIEEIKTLKYQKVGETRMAMITNQYYALM